MLWQGNKIKLQKLRGKINKNKHSEKFEIQTKLRFVNGKRRIQFCQTRRIKNQQKEEKKFKKCFGQIKKEEIAKINVRLIKNEQ